MVENNRAIAYIMQGELDRAEASLQRVLEVMPDDEEALHKLKIVHAKKGEQAVAVRSEQAAPAEGRRGEEEELRVEDLLWRKR
jgi:Flp pilus assembly protein TadD